jgi:folate-binding protein YgfZ
MPIAHLTDRSVISIAGEDATSFLAGLVTCPVDEKGAAQFGALLTPQGKIIADFFLVGRPEGQTGFLIDAPRAVADTLFKRLGMYKLRAKVTLSPTDLGVFASFGDGDAPAESAVSFADPRFSPMGRRLLAPVEALVGLSGAAPFAYEAHRIGLAVPQGGRDFAYGDAFPHEACMDQLGGIDFDKGCYVGQEVVSRTQHRGTARTRVAALRFSGEAPAESAQVTAGEKPLGQVGSVDAAQGRAIALLRLDRLAEALAANSPLVAGTVPVRAEKPAWARYAFPGTGPRDEHQPMSTNR